MDGKPAYFLGFGIGLDEILEPNTRRSNLELHGFFVKVGKSEIGGVAFCPFVVVDQGPWEVSPDVDAVFHRTAHLIHVFAEVPDFFLFTLCADAVFGNDDGLGVAAMDIDKHAVETFRIDEPSVLCVVGTLLSFGTHDEASGGSDLGIVIIHADQIDGIRDLVKVVKILSLHHIVNAGGWILKWVALPFG